LPRPGSRNPENPWKRKSPFRVMSRDRPQGTIASPQSSGRFAVLEWNPRLFSLLALIALLVVALGGGWSDLFSPASYWEW
jgi:hypothetical protein